MSFLERIISVFKSDYVLIYTAIGDDDCIRVTGKLSEKRIPYKTKVVGLYAGRNRRSFGFGPKLSQYKIYVKKEYEHKGHVAINNK